MSIFKRNKEEEDDYEEERDLEEVPKFRRIRDLKPENKKKRKEPPKPWGKKERYLVLIALLLTVVTSGVLATVARGWKLPGIGRLKITKPTLNFFGEETIVIGNNPQEFEKAKKSREFFITRTKALSGIYALFVVKLGDLSSYGVNENELMQAASLIKLPLMAAVYQESEAGELDLDKAPAGQKRTYRELVHAMGKNSDNEAFRIVRRALGDEKINSVIENVDMKHTSIGDNETTPGDIGTFFSKLWRGEIVSQDSRDEILESLTDTIYEDWIAAGITDVRVAHKYGREVHVVNDAGVIYSESPFILVIMTEGVIEREADEVIPELARGVYEIEK